MTDGGKFTNYMTNMYKGTREIFDKGGSETRRNELIATKCGAMLNAFIELEGLINASALSRQYFKRSAGWMSQRINGNKVFNKKAMFRETEYHQMAEAFRHIATRLQAHADEIDAAAPDEEIQK